MSRYIRHSPISLSRAIVLACSLQTLSFGAMADDSVPSHPLLQDNWLITLGGFYSRNNTTAGLAPSGGGTGVGIDFEDTLDLSDQDATPLLGAIWRISDRWRLDAEYFQLNRDARRELSADIQWGDQTYTAGTTVNSTFDVTDTRVSAGYSFFRTKDKEVGAGLGLHVTKFEASLDTSGRSAEGSDVSAPLPVVNLYAGFALTNTWAIRLRTDWLSLTYGDYSGDIRDMAIDVHYQPWQHLGLGFGVRNLVMDLDVDSSDWNGQARMNFQGPTAFVTSSF